MSGKRFLDTNVLIYSCNSSDAIAIHRKYQTRYWDSLMPNTACSEPL